MELYAGIFVAGAAAGGVAGFWLSSHIHSVALNIATAVYSAAAPKAAAAAAAPAHPAVPAAPAAPAAAPAAPAAAAPVALSAPAAK